MEFGRMAAYGWIPSPLLVLLIPHMVMQNRGALRAMAVLPESAFDLTSGSAQKN